GRLAPVRWWRGGAAYTPVSGSTIPIRTGVSPRAWMMKGDETCRAAAAAPLIRVRRSTLKLASVTLAFPLKSWCSCLRGVVKQVLALRSTTENTIKTEQSWLRPEPSALAYRLAGCKALGSSRGPFDRSAFPVLPISASQQVHANRSSGDQSERREKRYLLAPEVYRTKSLSNGRHPRQDARHHHPAHASRPVPRVTSCVEEDIHSCRA